MGRFALVLLLSRIAASRSRSVDVAHLHRHGFTVVTNVFSEDEIAALRRTIVNALGSGEVRHLSVHPRGNATKAYLRARGAEASIPDFVKVPQLDMVTALIQDPRIHAVLRQVFDGSDYRFASHSGIQVNKCVGWHKDWLNHEYARFQTLPLFQDATGDGGHFIVKVAIYLQDHAHSDDALTVIPGSHVVPTISVGGSEVVSLHPTIGSLVVFEQRITHRGTTKRQQKRTHGMRLLVSLGFGKRNNYTDEFERGTVARNADQVASATRALLARTRKPGQA
ncbi:hypothetical protein T492DRAFT_954148 [Pavlovales sp. CCMP2436]|nr:hypothetical protein T492DRAFT_954148 [Pavlovales sp. CCMP2436]